MNKPSSAIQKILRKSDSGAFTASFQLAKIYQDGIGVEIDNEKSERYKALCVDQIKNNSLRVDSVKVLNFKGFEEIEIDFKPKSKATVLVGNNGSGKSTILDAIQKCLSHIISRLTTRSYNGEQIEDLEIKNGHDFATVILNVSFNGHPFSMELSQSRPLVEMKKKSNFQGINDLGSILRLASSQKPNFPFPLLASYTVERANDVSTKDIERSDEILDNYIWDQSRGYSKSLTGKADFRLFFRWFKELVEQENAGNSEVLELRTQIQTKEAAFDNPLVKALMSNENKSKIDSSLIENYKKEISALKRKLNDLSSQDNKILSMVKMAIYDFLPGFSNLKLQRKPLDLTISKNGEMLSVLQLSQGEKSLLALVADIARRLTLLNPNEENPLDGHGVVLLDEIDLHLHPSWQQKIIKRLESTFKNIQFIVTTHSPQVCHTVDSENIWLLKNGQKYRAPKGVRGAVSSWVLQNLFEVEERPPEDKFTKTLRRYSKRVYDDLYDTPEALEDRRILEEHFGADYDVLVELNLYIENREWEKGLEED